jgi:hypothetical protein
LSWCEHNESFGVSKVEVTDCANCGNVNIMKSSLCQITCNRMCKLLWCVTNEQFGLSIEQVTDSENCGDVNLMSISECQ